MLRHGVTTAVLLLHHRDRAGDLGARPPGEPQFVYSLSIGIISWLVIDIGRLAAHRPRREALAAWAGAASRWSLVGIAVGFLGGNADRRRLDRRGRCWIPDLLAGPSSPPRLLITVAAGVAICYFYYSRGKAKYLEGQIALAERDATDARLKLLESQLEPHMLFNTLANLRALIATDPPRAQAMLDHLIGFLRATLAARARSRIRWRPSSSACATTSS